MCTCVEKLHILLSFSTVMLTIKVKSVTEILLLIQVSSRCLQCATSNSTNRWWKVFSQGLRVRRNTQTGLWKCQRYHSCWLWCEEDLYLLRYWLHRVRNKLIINPFLPLMIMSEQKNCLIYENSQYYL